MTTAIIFLVIFLANIIQGITGFAGTVLAMPAAMTLLGVANAKVILTWMALFSCGIIAWKSRDEIIWPDVVKTAGLMLFGMAFGLWLCDYIPMDLLPRLYGALIIIIGVRNLAVKKDPELSRGAQLAILLAAGVIHGLFLSGGALLVIYATFVYKEKSKFRAIMAPIWVILNALLLVFYALEGQMSSYNMTLVAINIIPLGMGTLLGNHLQKSMNQKTFMNLTAVLLIISGISLL